VQGALLQQRHRAGLSGLIDQLRLVEARDEDHARVGASLAQAPSGLEPVHFRHAHVDHRHLRGAVDYELDRGRAVARGPDHLQPLVVTEQKCQRVDEEPVIVDDHDTDGRLLEVSGQGA